MEQVVEATTTLWLSGMCLRWFDGTMGRKSWMSSLLCQTIPFNRRGICECQQQSLILAHSNKLLQNAPSLSGPEDRKWPLHPAARQPVAARFALSNAADATRWHEMSPLLGMHAWPHDVWLCGFFPYKAANLINSVERLLSSEIIDCQCLGFQFSGRRLNYFGERGKEGRAF